MCYKIKFVLWLLISQLLVNTFVMCMNAPQNTHNIKKGNTIVVARALNGLIQHIWKLFGFSIATSTNKLVDALDEAANEINKLFNENDNASIQQSTKTFRSVPRFAKMQNKKVRNARSLGMNIVGRYASCSYIFN